jgi:hypothetical protein
MKPARGMIGDLRILKGLFFLAVMLLFTAVLTGIIVFPLWFFSVNAALAFNIVIIGAAAVIASILAFTRKLLFPSIVFIILAGHLTGICLLFSGQQYLLAVILAADFAVSLELSRSFKWLLPIMRKILLGAAFCAFLYFTVILYKDQEWIYAALISLVILALPAFGVYGRKKAVHS